MAPETDHVHAPDERDIVLGFNQDTAANGGDSMTIIAASNGVLLGLADAISQGYVEFVDDGNGMTRVVVDSDGSVGAATAVMACTSADIVFVSNKAAAKDFADNIGVHAKAVTAPKRETLPRLAPGQGLLGGRLRGDERPALGICD